VIGCSLGNMLLRAYHATKNDRGHVMLSGSEASALALLRSRNLRCFAPAQHDALEQFSMISEWKTAVQPTNPDQHSVQQLPACGRILGGFLFSPGRPRLQPLLRRGEWVVWNLYGDGQCLQSHLRVPLDSSSDGPQRFHPASQLSLRKSSTSVSRLLSREASAMC